MRRILYSVPLRVKNFRIGNFQLTREWKSSHHYQEGIVQKLNSSLMLAGILSCIASLLHLAIIIGGPEWYRFFGAGEQMAQMAAQGSWYPTLITMFIAAVLFTWGLFAFSAAGIIGKLPFLKPVLIFIASIYTLRGLVGLFLAFMPQMQSNADFNFTFWIVSSGICLFYGAVHIHGLRKPLHYA